MSIANDLLKQSTKTIEYLKRHVRQLSAERKTLRSIVAKCADCLHKQSHGHTPNYGELMEMIEEYEDNFGDVTDDV